MIADDLAIYAARLTYADLSDDVVHQVKRHFIDAVGCALAAKDAAPVQIVRQAARINIPPLRAFLYGTMIRYFDYNDSYLAKEPAHPSDNIGAVLGVAEATKAHGKNVILATALAYELQCRLCDAASLRAHGWDHVIYGLVSSGLAAGKLMGLSAAQLTQVINLTVPTYLSTRQVREGTELSMWKACAFANVARNALFAAHLAKLGMTGPNDVFEGTYGLIRQTQQDSWSLDTTLFGKKKSHFKILDCWIKKWPAEVHSQSAIQATLELRPQVSVTDIDRILVETHEAGYTIIGRGKEKWQPNTRETADHSIPYVVGAALMDGTIDRHTFTPRRFRDKRLLALVKKISVSENQHLTDLYPKVAANIVRVYLTSGETVEKRVDHHRGHPRNRMSDAEIEEKFKTLTKPILSSVKQHRLLQFLWTLDKQKTILPLMQVLK
ncbi:MmgE/PrpD family protein [Candidatus Woesearchaeota archaeon]|nr:MmgE/PrpD family protein [Candidatus Woesearchaeota archaeon]